MVSEIQAEDEEMMEQLLRQGFLPLSTPVERTGEPPAARRPDRPSAASRPPPGSQRAGADVPSAVRVCVCACVRVCVRVCECARV